MVLKITNLHILRYLPTCWLYLLECYTIDNQRCTHTASKKKVGITVYYSKKHFDIAKGIRQAEEPQYYTVQEAMEKFKITRDQLYHYTKYHQIPKIKKGKYTLISKPELDNLFEDPIIE